MLNDFRNPKTQAQGFQSKLLFKKRMFRESDETVTEPQFVNLSYVQAQFDYLQGNYPVVREDAAQMCSLQMQSEFASTLLENEELVFTCIEKFITKQVCVWVVGGWVWGGGGGWGWGWAGAGCRRNCSPRAPARPCAARRQVLMTRPREEWHLDVLSRYRALEQFSKEEARIQFLRILRSLPYGNSVFFSVKRIEDPIGLLPPKLILGINKRGVHFFRCGLGAAGGAAGALQGRCGGAAGAPQGRLGCCCAVLPPAAAWARAGRACWPRQPLPPAVGPSPRPPFHRCCTCPHPPRRPAPKEYLHSAELRDIMQFGSSSSAVFFKMRVAGVLHIFQFETRQGEDICMALQTHINDIMMKRYTKVGGGLRPAAAAARLGMPRDGCCCCCCYCAVLPGCAAWQGPVDGRAWRLRWPAQAPARRPRATGR